MPHTRGLRPPENAVVLFDGTSMARWTGRNGENARWAVRDGYFEVVPGAGDIRTREAFGDVHLHIEWASPDPPRDTGQDRGNSGVFFMERYEVQVLDSYRSDTYPDGQAASIYGQRPPTFNASLPPGEWQTYDIFFRRPRFDADGTLREPARLTVLHNGILVQNNEEVLGRTTWLRWSPYEAHADALPISLQDHGSPVRFRNIWAVRLPELPRPPAGYPVGRQAVAVPMARLDRLAGNYDAPGSRVPMRIVREGDGLVMHLPWQAGGFPLVPLSETEFAMRDTDARIIFALDRRGNPTGLTFHLGGVEMTSRRAR
jgi:hypothetical protein